jgi:DNA-binding CsgD family transcriptional regulator
MEDDFVYLKHWVDLTSENFASRLKKAYPRLTDKEMNFCCLVRMNLSLQSLADIYCISKNSVSRRKLRMKEKMELAEETTLDEYLSLL